MGSLQELTRVVARQVAPSAIITSAATSAAAGTPELSCEGGNEFDGRLGVRISAIFVILVGSLFGAAFPVYAARHRGTGVPSWAFFVAKYFGSGIIIATAFIHLLAPANDALLNPCLTGPIAEYPWVEGIALMTIFVLFFTELMAMRYANFGPSPMENELDHQDSPSQLQRKSSAGSGHVPGGDQLSHGRQHVDNDPRDVENATH
ncbi:MAG: hypothetical protein Q9184_006632, partial [Pyrenodesmia sp. 2 TL-2023]